MIVIIIPGFMMITCVSCCHNPSPSPSKSESKLHIQSPSQESKLSSSLSPSQESKSKSIGAMLENVNGNKHKFEGFELVLDGVGAQLYI